MMTAAKLGAGSTDYYESTVAEGARIPGADMTDYYGEAGDAAARVFVVGRAGGDRAQMESYLGVGDGQVLDGLMVGAWFNEPIAPSGASLGRAYSERSVYGYDVTTAAPKSVSMLWGLSDDAVVHEQIVAAHEAAIRSALGYLSEHAGYTRVHNPVTGQKDLVRTLGLSGVTYQHRTSRAGDPHLHTHVLIHNRQVRADGGGVGSLDGQSLLHELKAGGSIYQAALRAELSQRLGVSWKDVDPTTGQADLKQVSREHIEAWSQRHNQISAWTDEHLSGADAGVSAAQLAQAQKATREHKETGASDEQLRAQWRSDVRAQGLDVSAWMAGARADAPVVLPSAEAVLEQLSQVRSTFTRADAVEVAAALMPPAMPAQQVRAAVEELAGQVVGEALILSVDPDKQHGERLAHEREGSVRYASTETIEREQLMLRSAQERVAGLAVDEAVLAASGGVLERLSADQRQAVTTMARSDARVTPFVAPAGSGKTFSLASLQQLYAAQGREVVGLAPTGKAADVMTGEGVVTSASTVAAMRARIEAGRHGWSPRTVVFVDEAGMVGTPDLARIIEAGREAGAKIVLTGDPAQLDPVKAAAGGFSLLAESCADTAQLSQVRRQVDADERAAGLALREGSVSEVNMAADWYAHADRLRLGNDAAMLEAAYRAWSRDRDGGLEARLITQKLEVADALNVRAQAERLPQLLETARQDAHRQGLSPRESDAFVKAQVRTVPTSRGQQARIGDDLITRKNTARLRASDEHGHDAGAVRNGQTWRVQATRDDGSVVVTRPGEDGIVSAFLPGEYVRESTHLGYAVSVHAAQGMTADRVHAVLDASTADRGALYVAMTRGRHRNTAYLTESRVGDQAHEHGAHASTVKPWHATSGEARRAFVAIASRDTRDRAAHTVLAEARSEYAAHVAARAAHVKANPPAELVRAQARAERRALEKAQHDASRIESPEDIAAAFDAEWDAYDTERSEPPQHERFQTALASLKRMNAEQRRGATTAGSGIAPKPSSNEEALERIRRRVEERRTGKPAPGRATNTQPRYDRFDSPTYRDNGPSIDR